MFNLIWGGFETLNPVVGLGVDGPSSSTAYHKEGIKCFFFFFREYEDIWADTQHLKLFAC